MIRRIALVVLGICTLQAQVDPRLKLSTDTLDAFKQGSAKPEVITVLDFSGSMTAVSWHPSYATSKDYDTFTKPVTGKSASDNNRTDLKTQDGSSSDSAYLVSLGSLSLKTKSGTSTLPAYALVPKVYGTLLADDVDLAGRLVAPDGNLVAPKASDAVVKSGSLDTTTWFRSAKSSTVAGKSAWILSPNHAYWLRQATHARLTYSPSYSGKSISGAVSRTLDIPLPYKLHDAPATALPGFNDGASSKKDPKSATTVQFDLVDGSADMKSSGGTISPFDYNDDYLYWTFEAKKDGSFIIPDSLTKPAWSNGLPVSTRYQAVKRAVLSTWLDVQDAVHWGFRYLDSANENKKTTIEATNTRTDGSGNLKDSSLRLFASISGGVLPDAVKDLQAREATSATPLTFALANALAQMVDGSVFATSRASEAIDGNPNPFADCRKHFVIAFTDGNANDAKAGADPTSDGSALGSSDPWASGTVAAGVSDLKTANLSNLNPTKSYFNTWTLAGLAAHGGEPDPVTKKPPFAATKSSGSGTPSDFAPFSILARDGKTFSKPHAIQTMTVGVSLAGTVKDTGADASKHNLLVTAGYADPNVTSWDYTKFVAKNALTGAPGEQAVNYYDATSNTALVASLNAIFKDITTANTSTTAPAAPVVGLRAGNQIYFGTFITAKSGPLWSGDLLMAGMQVKADKTVALIGKDGAAITGPITSANAIWAASTVLDGADWASRKVYTYFETKDSLGSTANRHEKLGLDLTDGAQAFSTANASLLTFMSGKADPTTEEKDLQKGHVEWMRGKDRSNRMGDVINGSPIGVEYTISMAKGLGLPNADKPGARFRVVFVGTNQGLFHAFGEISWKEGGLPKASAQELWAFFPKELLRSAPGYLRNSANPHAYLVDGTPTAYLDEEGSTKGTLGVVDTPDGGDIKDKALVVFGLGRGGRGTYALEVTDPGHPKLAWALLPDDEPADGNPTLRTMGLATGEAALARVWDGKTFRDLAFLPGGLSSAAVDAAFGSPLGRSVQALDVATGSLYAAWDFQENAALKAAFPGIGSIPAPVIPFQALRRSNLTQRIYFTDQTGGLFALGSNKTQKVTDTNPGFREDSSNPKEWTSDGTSSGTPGVRKIFQSNPGAVVTTSPLPFLLSQTYPGVPAKTGAARPYAVGVAFGFGDRNDPMDKDWINPLNPVTNTADGGGRHKLAVLFDRQDSGVRGTDTTGITAIADLTEATETQLDPTNESYYLKSADGYVLAFAPGKDHKKTSTLPSELGGSPYFYEKILSEPLVLQSTLYFNLFEPSDKSTSGANTCGGTGETRTYRIWDVLHPRWKTGWASDTATGDKGGQLFAFSGIAGRIAAVSATMIAVPGNMTHAKGGAVVDHGGKLGIEVGTDVKPVTGPAVRMRSWRIVR